MSEIHTKIGMANADQYCAYHNFEVGDSCSSQFVPPSLSNILNNNSKSERTCGE
jgi:hypothetical protein